jgi:hypothetical protein
MAREREFRDSSTLLNDVNYPLTHSAAADECSDVTLVLADGKADLGKLSSETIKKTFGSASEGSEKKAALSSTRCPTTGADANRHTR